MDDETNGGVPLDIDDELVDTDETETDDEGNPIKKKEEEEADEEVV